MNFIIEKIIIRIVNCHFTVTILYILSLYYITNKEITNYIIFYYIQVVIKQRQKEGRATLMNLVIFLNYVSYYYVYNNNDCII